jgi:hypothetical protein
VIEEKIGSVALAAVNVLSVCYRVYIFKKKLKCSGQ